MIATILACLAVLCIVAPLTHDMWLTPLRRSMIWMREHELFPFNVIAAALFLSAMLALSF